MNWFVVPPLGGLETGSSAENRPKAGLRTALRLIVRRLLSLREATGESRDKETDVWRLLCEAAGACLAANQGSIPRLAHTVPMPTS